MGVETNKLVKDEDEELCLSIGEGSDSDASDHTTSSDELTRISPSTFDQNAHSLLVEEYNYTRIAQ